MRNLFGVAGIPAKIQTEHFPSTSVLPYPGMGMFGGTNYVRANVVLQNEIIEMN
jgi:hypothetical protein